MGGCGTITGVTATVDPFSCHLINFWRLAGGGAGAGAAAGGGEVGAEGKGASQFRL